MYVRKQVCEKLGKKESENKREAFLLARKKPREPVEVAQARALDPIYVSEAMLM